MRGVTITIPGKPFAKQRPRFSRASGRTYTPAETVQAEQTLGVIAAPHFPEPMRGPVRVTIHATFATPRSWSKKKTAEMLHRCHTQRPDIDNISKWVGDGLNRIAWSDDQQVAELHVSKVWGTDAKTVVMVEPLEAWVS